MRVAWLRLKGFIIDIGWMNLSIGWQQTNLPAYIYFWLGKNIFGYKKLYWLNVRYLLVAVKIMLVEMKINIDWSYIRLILEKLIFGWWRKMYRYHQILLVEILKHSNNHWLIFQSGANIRRSKQYTHSRPFSCLLSTAHSSQHRHSEH